MSHLEWARTLPNGWEAKPLRSVADYAISTVDKLSAEGEVPVRLCNYSEVYNREFIGMALEFMSATATQDEIHKFRLAVGDVLITKDSETWDDIGVPALVRETADDLVCGYHLAVLRPNLNRLTSAFLFRCLQAKPVRVQLELAASNGVTRFGIPKSEIGMMLLPVPSCPQQRAIADYLGRETARLDALIAAKERLLTILAEKRQAIISQTVRRGINPGVSIRDSGVPWLGEIPNNWEIKRAKFFFEQAALPVRERDEIVTCFRDGQVTLRRNRREAGFTNADKEVGYQAIRRGQLVLHSMDAFAGAIGVSDSDGRCSPEYIICEPKGIDVDRRYYGLLLRTMALAGFIQASCPAVRERAPRIRFNDFGEMLLPVPPLERSSAQL